MTTPEGYGAAATGGGAAAPVIVTTYADLKAKISTPAAAVLLVSGVITVPDGGMISAVVTDKTILGLPGAKLVNLTQTQSGSGILYLKNGSKNVIIRNLIFEGPGAYDVDGRDNLTSNGCIDLWVDHCEFQDGIDGNFDINGTSDNITVSWCKFTYLKPPISGGSGGSNDHRFSNLVASSSSDAPADGHYSVTFQNCYWADGCKERMPRARNSEFHILNCYYNTSVSGSRALGLGGGINNLSCYVEHTDFAKIGTTFKDYSSSDGGVVSLVFDSCLNGAGNFGTVPKPSYTYSVLPVAEVAAVVPNAMCGAGATLQVTTDGVISSPCGSSGTNDPETIQGVKFYPAVIEDTLYIEFPDDSPPVVSIAIYSASGQLLRSLPDLSIQDKTLELNVSTLSRGMYFCLIQGRHKSVTHKLIKG